MTRLFIPSMCAAFVLYIFSSCSNTEKDCKKLIVKTWQIQKVELDPERKMGGMEDYPPELIEKLNNAKYIYAFTSEGYMLDNNSTRFGEYKLTLDCEKIIWYTEQHIDTFLIKDLTNDKFVMRGNGLISTLKPLK